MTGAKPTRLGTAADKRLLLATLDNEPVLRRPGISTPSLIDLVKIYI